MAQMLSSHLLYSTLSAYIANNMDPDQTAPRGSIVFASIVKDFWSAFELYAAM